jgi:hypothetical protein
VTVATVQPDHVVSWARFDSHFLPLHDIRSLTGREKLPGSLPRKLKRYKRALRELAPAPLEIEPDVLVERIGATHADKIGVS